MSRPTITLGSDTLRQHQELKAGRMRSASPTDDMGPGDWQVTDLWLRAGGACAVAWPAAKDQACSAGYAAAGAAAPGPRICCTIQDRMDCLLAAFVTDRESE
jgi:hypothetical protein